MKASMVPFDAASKQSSGCMIWPLGKTSIRNRPSLISSTTFASRSAVPCNSFDRAQVVDMRHWTFGWAMTLGAWMMAPVATAAIAPLAVAMNLRRSVITLASSYRHELVVSAFGDVVPGAHQRLELREGRVHLPGHGGLLGLLPDDLRRQLLEITQHRHRELDHLDLALELRLEPFERDRVLRVVVREAIDLHCRGGMVERPSQIGRERFVRLLVEAELERGARLVPARVVVIASGLVKPELHVFVRPDPFSGVDHAPLERGVDLGAGYEDPRGSRLGDDASAEARHAHLQTLEVAGCRDFLPEPPSHLRSNRRAGPRHEVERGVCLLPELEPVTLVEPGGHALRIHAERDGMKALEGRLSGGPVGRDGHERLDGALRGGVEALERWNDLAAGEDLDPESPAAHLLHDGCQPLGCALQ